MSAYDATAGLSARRGAKIAALLSLAVTGVLAAAKLVVGVITGSVGVLSDGVQSALDVGTSSMTLFAVVVASRPPDREHPYGHGRAENLAALGEATIMAAAGVWLAWEAVTRLASGASLQAPWYAIALIGGSMAVDTSRVVLLRRASKRHASPALEADAMNFTGDIVGSAAVLVGLGVARAGLPAGDAIAALVVVVLIWFMALRVGASAVNVLMDRAPTGGIDERLSDAARRVVGVVGVEGVRVRRSGPHAHAELTVSVGRTHSVEQSHEIAREVEHAVQRAVPGTSAVVRVEPSEAGEDLVGRTFAAANRIGLADQIHNVLAIDHPEGLWLMLHAKVDPKMALGRAHEVTDALESELRLEIPRLARVEIHLEPREPKHLVGTVVSAQQDELARGVRKIAESNRPITRCHEVAITETPEGLHLVLHCEAPPSCSIAEIHDASLVAEDEIHRRYADVRTVTVHFEPAGT